LTGAIQTPDACDLSLFERSKHCVDKPRSFILGERIKP
jgi:hypothetical protein